MKKVDRTCCGRTLECLAAVPCPTMVAWISMMIGIGGFTGSLIVGIRDTRDLLKNQHLLPFLESILIGLICGMFTISSLFLLVSFLSSGSTSLRVFNTSRKNVCARVLCAFFMMVGVLLHFIWLMVTSLLVLPLVLILIIYLQHEHNSVNCINLQNYGFFDKDRYCGAEFDQFWTQSQKVAICYLVAFISSVLVTLSLMHFLICTGANYAHLKESRFATLNAYKDEVRASKDSILDTKM